MDRAELLSQVRAGRERFEAVLARVDDAHMNDTSLYQAWSVKDLLAHVGEWEKRAGQIVDALASGGRPDRAIEEGGIDDVNAGIYRQHHDRPLPDVRRFEQDAYAALLASVNRLSDDDLFNPQRFAWTNGQPLSNWVIWNSYEHYDEHLVELNALLAK